MPDDARFSYPDEPVPGPPWHTTLVPSGWPVVHGLLLEPPGGRLRSRVTMHGTVLQDEEAYFGTAVHVFAEQPLPRIGYALSALHGVPRLVTLTTRPVRSARPPSGGGEVLIDDVPVDHGSGHVGPVARFGRVGRVIAVRYEDADVTVAAFDDAGIPRTWTRADAAPFHLARATLLGAG